MQRKDSPRDFPQLAGSHLKLASPALEFVKAVCEILHLDPALRHPVDVLKAQLLRLLAVRGVVTKRLAAAP